MLDQDVLYLLSPTEYLYSIDKNKAPNTQHLPHEVTKENNRTDVGKRGRKAVGGLNRTYATFHTLVDRDPIPLDGAASRHA